MSLYSLSGKTAIITGAAKGIGESIARLFARQGASVHILDVDEAAGQLVAEQIGKGEGTSHYHKTNVADGQAVVTTFDQIADQAGHIDIVVNNAGISHIGTLEETSEDDMDRLFAVNVKGAYHCSLAGVRKMKAQGSGGVILNVASIAATVGLSERFGYSVSKGAILTMTYSIAKDYIDDHIRCNAISPARVHTPFVDSYLKETYPDQETQMFEELSRTQPIGRMGKPNEVAGLALYLCSDEAAFITGANYRIDGGFSTLNT